LVSIKFRDSKLICQNQAITIILKKHGLNHGIATIEDDKKSPNEKSTQAYKLFSEGKTLIEASIKLGLRQKETSRFFMEFLKLKHHDRLYELYPQIEHYLAGSKRIILNCYSLTANGQYVTLL
jgi:hypothetical protein